MNIKKKIALAAIPAVMALSSTDETIPRAVRSSHPGSTSPTGILPAPLSGTPYNPGLRGETSTAGSCYRIYADK